MTEPIANVPQMSNSNTNKISTSTTAAQQQQQQQQMPMITPGAMDLNSAILNRLGQLKNRANTSNTNNNNNNNKNSTDDSTTTNDRNPNSSNNTQKTNMPSYNNNHNNNNPSTNNTGTGVKNFQIKQQEKSKLNISHIDLLSYMPFDRFGCECIEFSIIEFGRISILLFPPFYISKSN